MSDKINSLVEASQSLKNGDQAALSWDGYLQKMYEVSASDLYLTAGSSAMMRGDDGMRAFGDKLDAQAIDLLIDSILSADLKAKFLHEKELNMSIERPNIGRFRINMMFQKNMPALVIRHIVSQIPSFEKLGLPDFFRSLSLEKRGLILVTGVTASGKSTTLASMLDYRNEREKGHIITIEDPIEYFHSHKQSVVTQREVGIDTASYAAALKNTLRQRPDVILIGEIRDREVMDHALTISETGHLAMATLHTTNAYQTIERIVNFFPEEQSAQIRLNLSLNLRAIVSQRLLPAKNGGLALAQEILINEGLIKELILTGEILKIREVMEDNQIMNMQTFDQSLLKLYGQGSISEQVAIAYSDRSSDMKVKLRQVNIENQAGGFNQLDTADLSLSD